MSRFKRIALIALALQSTGGIVGRTKFQKIMYLANLCGWNAAEFRYDNFGPYSETLARELEGMRENGWVEEKVEGTRRDRRLYTYALSRPYRQRAISTIGKLDEMGEGKLIHKTEGLTKVLNKFDSDNLEIMATLIFLRSKNPSLSIEETIKLAHQLKPRFDEAQIKDGRKIFNIMKDFLPPREAAKILVA
jgi:uncharacterized protein YwgA